MLRKIRIFIFGQEAPSLGNMNTIGQVHTYVPSDRPDFNEWAKLLNSYK